ncbi:MAG: hypothetical protein ACI9EF_000948 [Pseudohongiellaceae bacterium]|jgi:hypothetical protein
MSGRVFLLFVILNVVAGVVFLSDCGPGFPLDDTWVHMVYARALGHGEGFAYNPGQLETGISAPLWTTLLAVPVAIADLLGQRPDLLVRLFSGLTGLAMAVVAWRLASPSGRWPATCAALAMTFDPLLVFERYSGMEQPLFGLITLLLVDAMLSKRAASAGLLSGLLILTRPEGLLFAAIAGLWMLRQRQPILPFIGRVALCVAPWLLYCQVVADSPLPATVVNKAAFVPHWQPLWRALSALFAETGWGWALPLTAAMGLYVLEGGRRNLGRLPLALGLILLPAVLLSRSIETYGAPPQVPYYWARYAFLAWPLVLFVASVGVASMVRTAYAGTRCQPVFAALLIGPALVMAVLGRDLPAQGVRLSRSFAAQCSDVETLNVSSALWVAENLPADALVLSHDAGALRFFGQHRVLEIWGNHNTTLRHILDQQGGVGVGEWIQSQDPDALVVFPTLFARNHAPDEWKQLFTMLPTQEYDALYAQADDYASLLGLTRRVARFHVDEPTVVPSPLHSDMVVFVRP